MIHVCPHCLTVRIGQKALQVVHAVDGRDRWLWITGKSITDVWKAPRWLSWTRSDGKLRGGC